jgi:hypothetical protein
VGKTLREMKGSPVPVVTLEVALVRLTHPDLDDSVAALEERVSRLERYSAASHAPVSAPPPAAPRPIPSVARAARESSTTSSAPTLAPSAAQSAPESRGAPRADTPDTPSDGAAVDSSSDTPPPTTTADDEMTNEEFARRFSAAVLPRLARSAQVFLAQSTVRSVRGTVVTFTVPSEAMKTNVDRIQNGLRGALEHEFHVPYQIQWVVDDDAAPLAPASPRAPASVVEDDPDDEVVVEGSEPLAMDSVATLLITEAFPGAEEIT